MSFKEYAEYERNPFRIDGGVMVSMPKIKVTNMQHVEGRRYLVDYDRQTGMSDRERHVRLYKDGLEALGRLSATGLQVLVYAGLEVLRGGDEVYLNVEKIRKDMNVSSRTTVYNGIEDLLKNKFLVRSYKRDVYFINPFFFYGGSRTQWWLAHRNNDEYGMITPKDMMVKG